MNAEANEDLLNSWMELSLRIRENRFLKNVTFNGMAICSLLENNPQGLTAAELCRRTRLLKSQMNKELSALESRDIIVRRASAEDKRMTLVFLEGANAHEFHDEHARVEALFSRICAELGEEKARSLSALLLESVEIADRLISEE